MLSKIDYFQQIGDIRFRDSLTLRDTIKYDTYLDYFWVLGLQFSNNNLPHLPLFAKEMFTLNNALKRIYSKPLKTNSEIVFIQYTTRPKFFKKIQDKLPSYDIINLSPLSAPFYHSAYVPLYNLNNDETKTCDIIKRAINIIPFTNPLRTFIKKYSRHINFYFSPSMITMVTEYYKAFCNLIKNSNIKLFIVEDVSDVRIRALVKACEKYNVPLLHIYHGLSGEESPLCYSPVIYKSVPGALFEKKLLKLGFKESQIKITGPIFMDGISPEQYQESDYYLFLTQTMVEDGFCEKKMYLKAIESIIKQFSGKRLIIKMHPRENGKRDYIKLCKKHNIINYRVLGKEADLHQLIRKCKMVVAYGSTASVEAIAYGKTVILYNMFPWHYEGEEFMEGLFKAKDQGDYVRENLKLDNQAITRNIDLILILELSSCKSRK